MKDVFVCDECGLSGHLHEEGCVGFDKDRPPAPELLPPEAGRTWVERERWLRDRGKLSVLPEDVVEFLSDPDELQRVRWRMADVEQARTSEVRRVAEAERRAALPLTPCKGGGYGCGKLTPGGFTCEDCKAEYRADPDAFK